MAAEITTIDDVKIRGGIALSVTTWDATLALIVPAVNARIAEVCSRNFTYQKYSETRNGNNNNNVTLRNGPIETIFYSATGKASAIQVKFVGAANLGSIDIVMDMSEDSDGIYKVKIIEGTDITEFVIDDSTTINSLVASIDGLVNWEATVESDVGLYPALAIMPRFYPQMEADEIVQILMATSSIGLQPIQRVDAEYDASRPISRSEDITVIYQGGYAEMPSNLVDAATQIALNTFDMSQTDQTLAGESIGNYSWNSAIGNFINEQLPAWYSTLNNFKNPAVA